MQQMSDRNLSDWFSTSEQTEMIVRALGISAVQAVEFRDANSDLARPNENLSVFDIFAFQKLSFYLSNLPVPIVESFWLSW